MYVLIVDCGESNTITHFGLYSNKQLCINRMYIYIFFIEVGTTIYFYCKEKNRPYGAKPCGLTITKFAFLKLHS